MVSIASDNSDIERALRKIVALSEKEGAEFSKDLVIKCVNSNLRLEAPTDIAGEVLIRLPWNSLVPVEPFRLRIVDNDIVIFSYEEGLTSSCLARMEAILELYNVTGKLAQHRRKSPLPLIFCHSELLRFIARRQPGIASRYEKFCGLGENALVLDAFLNTRVFDYRLDTARTLSFFILMPVLDLMNHDISGAAYHDDQKAGDRALTMRRSVPVPRTGNECFARYGRYDAFDTWLTYDFVDRRVPFVSSVAMTIDLPRLGTIRLTNSNKLRTQKDLPEDMKDLWFYIPQLHARSANQTTVGSLLIPGPQAA